ncbi:protein YhfH [Bacillus massilinigeriensis]|nr:protein YhfH [Bacillus massilionigeriensis]
MITMDTKQSTKECRECGCKIIEKEESYLYECERCIGRYEE